MQSDEITQADIDLLSKLRASPDLPNYFWQLPLIRFFLLLVAVLVLGIAADIFFDQKWLPRPLPDFVSLWTGCYVGLSLARNRRYEMLLLKLLDRDPELRRRL